MRLSVFLAMGESWEDFCAKGQDKLLLNNNFKEYCKNFEYVYVFSYGKQGGKLLSNLELMPNSLGLHRYIYWFLLPLFYRKEIRRSSVLRGMQLTGGLPAFISKILWNKKIVVNYGYDYASVSLIENKPVRAYIYKLATRILMPLIDQVIITNPTLRSLIPSVKKATIHIIPNGIDTTLFKPKELKKSIPILYVGRLSEQKNLFLLISAVARIKTKPAVLFIGSGILKEKLLLKAKLLHVQLYLKNPLPHSDLVKYYNSAKVFVLPSYIEGHPKALLEAMSCRLAVIGTNVQGIRDIVSSEKNGLLVSANEVALSQAIERLLNNPNLRLKIGEAAREYIKANFDSRKTWKKEISLLKKTAI